MSDLFARLVDRARGTSPIVRPRVPGVFEAAHDEAGEIHVEVERRPEPTAAKSLPNLVRTVAPPPHGDRAETGAVEIDRRAPEPAARPAATTTERREAQQIEEVRHARRETPGETQPARPSRVPPEASPPDATRVGRRGEPAREREVETRHIERILQPAPDRAAEPPVRERPDPPGERARIAAAGIRTARPQPPDARESALATPEADAGPPVVRVTIGRVDVRAVQEPTRERRRPKDRSSHRMGLDEYLRRRNGGT